ncbi:MAG TPA: hypothetical protein VGE11_02270 [Pseudonocardia sp.]
MHTRARVAGVLILTASALAGCTSATPGPTSSGADTPPVTPTPATTAPATSAQAPPTASPPTPNITLPWPVSGAAKAAALQQAVDGGAQPWLLDPTEVALSYAAARGWSGAQAASSGTDAVTVRSSAGTHALTLAQPARKGDAGIWVVTGDSSR